ncbi:MAG: DUF4434 domain-containing protein [Cyclobacteriaceae bacterium]|nr:DUF4434 domain-containing protein [Cyclobacteriaceae bacterium]
MENLKNTLFSNKVLFMALSLWLITTISCKEKTVEPVIKPPIEEDTIIVGGIGSTTPFINGTFIDFWGKSGWAATQWDAHMVEMKEIGIQILFVQFSAYNEIIWIDSPNDYSTIIYENALANLLNSAERNDIKVYVGLYFNENYWQNASNAAEMNLHAQRSKEVANAIWKRSKNNKAFAGWYISHEGAPYYYDTETKFNVLKNNLINPIANYCKSISDKPVLTTVFFNHNLTDIQKFRLFMKRMAKCNLDAILLQDGIGVSHASLETIGSYYQAANDGLFTDGSFKGAFWADIETFTPPDGEPESFAVVKEKLTIIAPTVSKIITFQYYKDMSPSGPNGTLANVLRQDYYNYYKDK